MTRSILGALSLLAVVAAPLTAQSNATLRRAETFYRDLAYGQAVAEARSALGQRLGRSDHVRAYEILGFAYASLDSTRQSTEAFKQLLFLSPDRELDPARISPKITSLFALALGQVLVVRQLRIDGGSFLAGTGTVPIRFTITRNARVRTRIVGVAGEAMVDSSLGDGTLQLRWNGLLRNGRPAPSGDYRLIVEASAGRDTYAASVPVRVVAGAVDTVAHLTALPGYDILSETEIPPRSWRPLGIAFLATAATSGAIIALENSSLRSPRRREIATIGVSTSVVGLLAIRKRPMPVPAPANIRYNALVREQLARRNVEIASENARRRLQVKLAVAMLRTAATKEESP